MNYVGFKPDLNVIRVSDLVEEIYSVYDGNPEYCFCSIDVVRMFDCIPMKGVIEILGHLETRMESGFVNIKALTELISMDVNLFDYFKYVSPLGPRRQPIKYYHQRIGIPMGGNTSSIYADLYMSFHLSKMGDLLTKYGIKLIKKYVDDYLIYLPRKMLPKFIADYTILTKLDFTMEYPNEKGYYIYI